MRLATFEQDGRPRVGLVAGDDIVDLSQAAPELPRDMIGLIRDWSRLGDAVRTLAGTKPHLSLRDVRLLAPVPAPQKILAIGLNYADHVAESGHALPEKQTWFAKLPSAVNGPFDPIELPKASTSVDYEAELVFVIGKRCRHVTKEQAPDVVFGYCAGNDVSAQ